MKILVPFFVTLTAVGCGGNHAQFKSIHTVPYGQKIVGNSEAETGSKTEESVLNGKIELPQILASVKAGDDNFYAPVTGDETPANVVVDGEELVETPSQELSEEVSRIDLDQSAQLVQPVQPTPLVKSGALTASTDVSKSTSIVEAQDAAVTGTISGESKANPGRFASAKNWCKNNKLKCAASTIGTAVVAVVASYAMYKSYNGGSMKDMNKTTLVDDMNIESEVDHVVITEPKIQPELDLIELSTEPTVRIVSTEVSLPKSGENTVRYENGMSLNNFEFDLGDDFTFFPPTVERGIDAVENAAKYGMGVISKVWSYLPSLPEIDEVDLDLFYYY